MKLKGSLLPLLCVLLAAFAVPAGASAKPGHPAPRFESSAEAHLVGTHGYRIAISASGRSVQVRASKGLGSVTYLPFESGLKSDRIDARLPGAGRVSLRFHEHSRSYDRLKGDCPTLTRKGVFVGLVKIRGERNYTRAESHHVRGKIVREPRDRCHRRATARASSADSEVVSASTERGRGFLSFTALNFPSRGLKANLIFVASLFRIHGQMIVMSQQGAFSENTATLAVAKPPRSAIVNPPAPFTGTATFQQESADQFSWTGDLAGELPGIGDVDLAGPKFETSLCLGGHCRGDEEATEDSTIIAVAMSTAAAPTPSPWRWPGSLR
jgi:hypothetical protein